MEGLRVWEAGITLARYFALEAADSTQGKVVVELGSGTGIAGLSLLKYTQAAKVVFSDYKQSVLDLLRENIALQEGSTMTAEAQVELVDWTN